MTAHLTWKTLRVQALADGITFESSGRYERIDARVELRVDPLAAPQQGIVDLHAAPRDRDGRVCFTTDVQLLRPVDPSRGNRRLFVEIVNRGNKRCLQFFNDAPGNNDPLSRASLGNAWLMRRGYTVCWIGWEADILPGDARLTLDVPVARGLAGKDGDKGAVDVPITGSVRSEFIANQPGRTVFPLSGWPTARSYPAVSLDTREASLVRRRYPGDRAEPVSPDAWQFARVEGGGGLDNQGAERAVIASDRHIYLPTGFEPGWIYELIYQARDPLVLGLGHVAVRDITSFLRHGREDDQGHANPLYSGTGAIERAYAWGRSQSGRYLRDFVYQGFNADAQGRRVFDGILPHVSGGGLMWMNHRFASVIRPAGQEYEDHWNPADRFPFSYAWSTDHLSGRSDAILKRPDTDPYVLHTQSATEYWQRHGSLVHTDTAGNDLDQPAQVRVYLWSSSQHFADPLLRSTRSEVCLEDINGVQTSMLFRATLDALDAWVTDGVEPPASRVPRRDDGTLVSMGQWRQQFPAIPGVICPRGPSPLPRLSWGPAFEQGILAEPPQTMGEQAYVVAVPGVDADGNDLAGIRAPMVSAPLATYTGWNLRARGKGFGAMHEFTGSTIPFAVSESERVQTGDPRASLEQRYPSGDAYVEAIRQAAQTLVEQRLMLADDIETSVEAARQRITARAA